MKELTIEEKAKLYDEAIDRAEKWRNAPNVDKIPTFANRVIDDIFPELTESEDEKIRKALIFHFQGDGYLCNKVGNIPNTDILAWLEKQGEHSVSHLFTFEDVLTIQCAMAYAKFQDRELDVALKKLHDKVYDAYHDSKNHHIESQDGLKGEQKPCMIQWKAVDKEIYVKEPALAQRKDKSEPNHGYVICYDHTLTPDVYERFIMISDIYNQSHWKPSDEQMDALNDVISSRDIKYDVLSELWKDLKKLKG